MELNGRMNGLEGRKEDKDNIITLQRAKVAMDLEGMKNVKCGLMGIRDPKALHYWSGSEQCSSMIIMLES